MAKSLSNYNDHTSMAVTRSKQEDFLKNTNLFKSAVATLLNPHASFCPWWDMQTKIVPPQTKTDENIRTHGVIQT